MTRTFILVQLARLVIVFGISRVRERILTTPLSLFLLFELEPIHVGNTLISVRVCVTCTPDDGIERGEVGLCLLEGTSMMSDTGFYGVEYCVRGKRKKGYWSVSQAPIARADGAEGA